MKISFVIPCRSNAKYFKWAYNSIRKHQGRHDVYICAANDASQDETVFLFHEIQAKDDKFSYITNPGPDRVGHTILYDRIVRELVKTDVAIIWHADMYLCPGALDEIEKLMYSNDWDEQFIQSPWPDTPRTKTIVSLTRIEPPLHPDGPEKYLANWGTEPEDFNETAFLQWFVSPEANGYKPKYDPPYTNGIFAPWAFFVKDFLEIEGHDPLYRPQSKEDSDIFNRLKLNGCKFIQTWKGCTYHMTCRGSRFNPTLTTPGVNSSEWEEHNKKSYRNFIRKWGTAVQHDELLNPIIPKKYLTRFYITNSTYSLIGLLEPYCNTLYTDLAPSLLHEYCAKEQQNTDFDLGLKLSGNIICSIHVHIDGNKFNDTDLQIINNLSDIIESNKPIKLNHPNKIGNLIIFVYDYNDITNKLININNKEYQFLLK